MKRFELNIKCKECGSGDVHICKHLDFTGMDDWTSYTNDIVLVCQSQDCRNKELINLEYEILY